MFRHLALLLVVLGAFGCGSPAPPADKGGKKAATQDRGKQIRDLCDNLLSAGDARQIRESLHALTPFLGGEDAPALSADEREFLLKSANLSPPGQVGSWGLPSRLPSPLALLFLTR